MQAEVKTLKKQKIKIKRNNCNHFLKNKSLMNQQSKNSLLLNMNKISINKMKKRIMKIMKMKRKDRKQKTENFIFNK